MLYRIVGVLVAFALLAACDSTTPQNALGSRKISVSDRVAAPVVRGDYMDIGGSFDLAQQKGKVVVVNFWASYCAPCRTEAPELEKVYAATKADGVTFLGVNVHDQRDPAKAFLADIKPAYGSIFDPSASIAQDFAVPPNSIPATLVIDRAGRIAAVIRMQVDQKLLEPIVRELLAEQA
ncbi:TlpA family protein disulfide reductase [Dactylosporangium sp. NBC_01737]|uniref:TlpA family protein disulfide reductase n=1 Tax=Dactylosporangium sp. NBC_01737 TaxID=2975959 RepID=UPI002E147810|nr:TlpA family protein disulfide reductase [Dactylosporangium sp. NBC_01737]